MAKKSQPQSQLLELLFHIAEQLGYGADRDIAALAEVSVENVAHWRSGASRELKGQTFEILKDNLAARFKTIREHMRLADAGLDLGLVNLEIEEGSSPADLQRKFVDKMVYDYLGHRFLYYEPQGALAWENLIKRGYEQDAWLRGVQETATRWLDLRRDGSGRSQGAIARALGFDKRSAPRGIDVLSLGPGEGDKELLLLERLSEAQASSGLALPWLTVALVDVSIPLLVRAAKATRHVLRSSPSPGHAPTSIVLPFCADFEEGSLAFAKRLWTSAPSRAAGLRLVLLLGNVFGNLRDEDLFVRQRLWQLTRPGDLVWLEVGVRMKNMEQDPLYRTTQEQRAETGSDASRRLLLEGPYRRWEAAIGRKPSALEMRVWLREGDDSARVPGSCNFCHDLVIAEERRVCTMLYSRRYQVEGLTSWFESREFSVEAIAPVVDGEQRQRVTHLLLRRR